MQMSLATFFLLVFLAGCQQNDSAEYFLISGGTLYDGNGNSIANGDILIRKGRIEAIGNELDYPKHVLKIDASGKYITPGLVDAHVHFFQTGFFDSRPDALDLTDSLPYENVIAKQKANPERYFQSYLRSGITAVYDVGGLLSTLKLQDEAEQNLTAPHIAASGPLITPAPPNFIEKFNLPGDTIMVFLKSV